MKTVEAMISKAANLMVNRNHFQTTENYVYLNWSE